MAEASLLVQLDNRTFTSIEGAYGEIFRDLDQAAAKAFPQVKKDLMNMLLRVMSKLEKMHGQQWPGKSSPGKSNLYKRSGMGLKDIRRSIEVTGGTLSELKGIIDPVGYMEMHETGGTIEPQQGQYLTVPLPAALNSRGLPRKPSAYDWGNTFVKRSKKGSLLIFQRRGRNIIPLYVLVERVRLKPRLRLEETFNKELPYFEAKAFERIAEVLSK